MQPYFVPVGRLWPIVLAGLALLVSGCANWREPSCAQFEQIHQETDYNTHYQRLEPDTQAAAHHLSPLPQGASAVVHLYEMRVDPYTTKSCNHLKLHKEIHIQRRAGGKLLLEETREFYTINGALIATRTESIGHQLHRSGFYAGSALLPIPAKAPSGRYRVVSKLMLRNADKSKATVLAKTSASFQVIARE